jgi:mannose-6-phosphate isomerase
MQMNRFGTASALRSLRTAEWSAGIKLPPRFVKKPWGLKRLPEIFGKLTPDRIGEIWFGDTNGLPLLAKYLFTSEPLSVQVHPNDEQAQLHGFARGKAECWFVIDAKPGAMIGLGLSREMTRGELREAALDGSIEQLIEWRPVAAGDFYYVPPGTIHAIGAGICLLEFQQSSDLTYRLYDYGRPRKLHLDEAVAVANPGRYAQHLHRQVGASENVVLANGPHFTLVHTRSHALQGRRRWVLPLDGHVLCDGEMAFAGECMLVEGHGHLDEVRGRLLIGAGAED